MRQTTISLTEWYLPQNQGYFLLKIPKKFGDLLKVRKNYIKLYQVNALKYNVFQK